MSHLWNCILLWCTCCLLIIPEIVTARSNCVRSGDCASGFYCHTGGGLCMSCDKCSEARGNLNLCEKECYSVPVIHASPSTVNIPVIVTTTVVVTVCLVVAIVAVIWRRRCRNAKNIGIGIAETGEPEPSRIGLNYMHPLAPDCALPDEAVNHSSSLLPIINDQS